MHKTTRRAVIAGATAIAAAGATGPARAVTPNFALTPLGRAFVALLPEEGAHDAHYARLDEHLPEHEAHWAKIRAAAEAIVAAADANVQRHLGDLAALIRYMGPSDYTGDEMDRATGLLVAAILDLGGIAEAQVSPEALYVAAGGDKADTVVAG